VGVRGRAGLGVCECRRVLADLHLHVYGCIRARVLLEHLAGRDTVRWEEYEAGVLAAFGEVPPTREVVARYRSGDGAAAAEFERLFVVGDDDAGSFDRFQAKFDLAYAGSALGDPGADAAAAAAEVAGFAAAIRADQAAAGVTHAEYRIKLGADLSSEVDRAVLDTLLAGYDRPGGELTERLAVSLDRADPWAGWDRVQELALGPHGAAFTAVDFCGVEEGFPPKGLAGFFTAVRALNAAHPQRALAVLCHVGESFQDKSLESAVRWVQEVADNGAHRLGHAIALGVDPDLFGPHTRSESVGERRDQIGYDLAHRDGLVAVGVPVDVDSLHVELTGLAPLPADATLAVEYDQARLDDVRRRQQFAMSRVRATGAVIEVCPTSNRQIGGISDPAHHPVHRFLAAGLPVVVGSDDPGVLDTTLTRELDQVCAGVPDPGALREQLLDTAVRSRSEVLTGRISYRRSDLAP